jgi:D-ribose pyranase
VKTHGILNPALGEAIAEIGHGDVIVLADAGLRIPAGRPAIHLEVTCGVPTMAQVVTAVLSEMVVETALVATEFREWNPDVHDAVVGLLPVTPSVAPHVELMADMAARAKLYVKTGECSAYASVALVAGVNYLEAAVLLRDKVAGQRERGERA